MGGGSFFCSKFMENLVHKMNKTIDKRTTA